jgi:hypothetical protein
MSCFERHEAHQTKRARLVASREALKGTQKNPPEASARVIRERSGAIFNAP